jgi:hypothetical protein
VATSHGVRCPQCPCLAQLDVDGAFVTLAPRAGRSVEHPLNSDMGNDVSPWRVVTL